MSGRAWRRGGALLVGGLLAACAHAPAALGAQQTVDATFGSSFSPARVTIAPGDSVVWRNRGGEHNVRFDDGAFEQPSEPSSLLWTTPPRVFPTPGRFTYYCERHGGPNRSGMSGVVVVETPGAVDLAPPSLSKARLKPRRGGRLALSFTSSEAGDAVVKLQRRTRRGRFKAVRTVRREVAVGKASISLRGRGGRALVPGRYRAVVTVRDEAGNISRAVRPAARIAPPS